MAHLESGSMIPNEAVQLIRPAEIPANSCNQ
jgi:hypothetical protein